MLLSLITEAISQSIKQLPQTLFSDPKQHFKLFCDLLNLVVQSLKRNKKFTNENTSPYIISQCYVNVIYHCCREQHFFVSRYNCIHLTEIRIKSAKSPRMFTQETELLPSQDVFEVKINIIKRKFSLSHRELKQEQRIETVRRVALRMARDESASLTLGCIKYEQFEFITLGFHVIKIHHPICNSCDGKIYYFHYFYGMKFYCCCFSIFTVEWDAQTSKGSENILFSPKR